ncbi:MAG TPA: helix-turn-helix domain-containing protein [Longimicrobiales bacterium]|nr:helix-turn-helix domain-containing protein [Longimicrobiales bacterium]
MILAYRKGKKETLTGGRGKRAAQVGGRVDERGKLTGARVTRAKVTARRVGVVPPPRFGERDVQRVREDLGLSQTVFAELIGASVSTVRAWERGARRPSDMARRLLELAERQPEVFEEDLTPSG